MQTTSTTGTGGNGSTSHFIDGRLVGAGGGGEQARFPFAADKGAIGGEPQLLRRLGMLPPGPGDNPLPWMRRIAALLVEHGRALGRTEQARMDRIGRRQRISDILDAATSAFRTNAEEATLEDWRAGRRLLWTMLSEWQAAAETEPLPDPPFPPDAEKLVSLLLLPLRLPRESRFARLQRNAKAYLNTAAEFLEALSETLERRREQRAAQAADD